MYIKKNDEKEEEIFKNPPFLLIPDPVRVAMERWSMVVDL
jgi:hypothetical protein